MTSLNDLQQDLKNVSDNVLSNLSAEEQVRMFLKAAAEGQDDRIEMLRDSAPRYEYETRDLEFTHGAIEAYTLSRIANASLERLYTATMMHEAGRNQYVAIVLLNEAVEKLSQGHFTVDEYGNADTPASWPHNYGPQYDPDESRLAEEHLGITFDEFLQASQAEKLPFDERTGPRWLTEESVGTSSSGCNSISTPTMRANGKSVRCSPRSSRTPPVSNAAVISGRGGCICGR